MNIDLGEMIGTMVTREEMAKIFSSDQLTQDLVESLMGSPLEIDPNLANQLDLLDIATVAIMVTAELYSTLKTLSNERANRFLANRMHFVLGNDVQAIKARTETSK